ncbi:MAG TPA: glycosyltransferase family 4 protein [Thermoanaerobaculia bacterium]|jgi:glycosyltransferase involved in cell wall biosynthesis|nr:glycosyltransferase family 4 protein [Thermoanaerobaculia bacterium]
MGAPQARLSELGERLIDLGWEVEALTALPNYPAGRVYPGYPRRRPAVETVGRIRTVRVPLLPSQKGFVKRLACYFSFAASAAWHGPRLSARPDVLFVESPPLFIGFAARRLARRWRCPYVLNVSDLWPQSAIEMGVVKPGLATRMAERLELSLYRHAAGVTGQSEEIVESVAARSPGTPVEVITNGVDPARFGSGVADDAARALIGPEPGPVFLYAGLLGLAQGLDQILDVAASLPKEIPGRAVLVGEGPVREALQTRIERERIDRVRLVPAQPRERIPALLAAADVAVATLGMRLQGAVPSKIYEAMASERPLLLIAEGEAARRVERAECGLTIRPGDLDGAREAWIRLATDSELRARLGAAGRRAAETTYDRARIAERLDRFLKKVLS